MPFTYILECVDQTFYVGSTWDLDQRLNDHAVGKVDGYTSTRRPVRLVWFHECDRIGEAFELEHKIKGWRRAKRIALIEGRFEDLPELSKAYQRSREWSALRQAQGAVVPLRSVPVRGDRQPFDKLRVMAVS